MEDNMSNTNKSINRVFVWIIIVIFVVFLLCCVTPYTYVKFFVPTTTPTLVPTSTPAPTEDVGLTYVTKIRELAVEEQSIYQAITITVKDISQSNLDDAVWRNDLYSKFDKLIEFANEAASLPPPAGLEAIQENLQNIHNEYVLAKASLVDYLENKNQNALQEFGKHLELADSYFGTVIKLINAKGY
jgi:hypothetical protein